MNLKEFLHKKGRLTKRERELIIDAWIEASRVFDEDVKNTSKQSIVAIQSEQDFTSCTCGWIPEYMRLIDENCPIHSKFDVEVVKVVE